MKRLSLLIALPFLLVACEQEVRIDAPLADGDSSVMAVSSADDAASSDAVVSSAAQEISSIPGRVRIELPFASQAPKGNWDMPYQEACEEASLIIVHHYLEGTALNADIMDRDILAMVDYEEGEGMPADIDMRELASVAKGMYGYMPEVVEGDGVTIERIEQELARGNPVIMPFAGQQLGNPYFSGDGPPYHVLVIVGYDSTRFITHDVGTRRGEYYAYDKDVIMSANHDWIGSKETIGQGPKRMLIVKK
jgi:hypothetical protein